MYYNPYINPYQAAYQQQMAQQMPQPQTQPQAQPQGRTVEVYPVQGQQAVLDFPVPVGGSVVLMATDDTFVAIKTNDMKSGIIVDWFDRRPPAPPAPSFDPAAYVTREELEQRLAALGGAKKGVKADEPV